MAIGDVYELSLRGNMSNQTVDNVFFYGQELAFVTTNPTDAQALAEGFNDQILSVIRQAITLDVSWSSIDVRNLFNTADQFSLGISVQGALGTTPGATETLPPFNAYSYTLQPVNAAVKPGAKRFAGIIESAQHDGIVVGAFELGLLTGAIADALEAPVLIGTVIQDPVFVPVIVKRVRGGTPGNYTYRLPANSAESVASRIAVALFNVIVSSQISRKIGVGS